MMQRDKKNLEKAKDFLFISSQFNLGELSTEKPHPLTHNLSNLVKSNPAGAIRVLKQIDEEALAVLYEKRAEIQLLAQHIRETLNAGHRVFICGCGATGRLALTLETLWREKYKRKSFKDRICSFMAGGDVALIKSIENFEDLIVFGVKQLFELGFTQNDLLISCTEGGETPFVIGATETAYRFSVNKPFFLYCNPDDILAKTARRSGRVLNNRNIIKINCDVGPMALTGSTRMQASTILMAVVGFALAGYENPEEITAMIEDLITLYKSTDLSFLEAFIKEEATCYQKGEYLFYETEPHFGITILTDITERSPTFSIHPFENKLDKDPVPSLCYILFPHAKSSKTAWKQLLHREPRTLEWDDIYDIASRDRLLGFDFSHKLPDLRKQRTHDAVHHHFKIYPHKDGICFELEKWRHIIPVKTISLIDHLVLKMALNIHSTLVMGRLGRYEWNIMTWVKASNNKLIDRAIRYVDFLLREGGVSYSYEEIAYSCFNLMDRIAEDESLVAAVVKSLSDKLP